MTSTWLGSAGKPFDWIVKPGVPTIDWSNSITADLSFDANYFMPSGPRNVERTNNLGSVITGTTPLITPYGPARQFGGGATSDGDQYTLPTTQLNTSNLISTECVFYINAYSTGGGFGRILDKGGNAAQLYRIYTEDSSSTVNYVASFSGGDNQTSFAVSTGTWWHMVTVQDRSDPLGEPTVYFNGVPVTLTRNATAAGTPLADQPSLGVGNRQDGTRAFNGYIMYMRTWNRLLSANEAVSLYNNPWQIYRRPRFWTRTSKPSGGGGTTVNLTGIGMTARAGAFGKTVSKTLPPATMTAHAGNPTSSIGKSITLPHAGMFAAAGTLRGTVSKTLPNINITTHAGTFSQSISISRNLPSVQMTMHAGTFSPISGKVVNLPPATATMHAGSFTKQVLKTIPHVGMFMQAGSFSPISGKVVNLPPATATMHAGIFTKQVIKTLAGLNMISHAGSFAASTSKSVALPSATASLHAGTFAKTIAKTLPANNMVARAGNMAINIGGNITINMVGFKLTAAAGTFARQVQKTLPSNGMVTHAGSIVINLNKILTGVQMTAHAGTFTPSSGRIVNLPSTGMIARAGTFAYSQSLRLTGLQMTMHAGHFTINIPQSLGIATARDFALFSASAVDLAKFAAINTGIIQ